MNQGKKLFLTLIIFSVLSLFSFILADKPAFAANGYLIKGSASTVYYYSSDGARHAFPNEKTYFTWYSDFSQVTAIPDNKLADIAIGKNVTYKPGVKMVKFITAPKVYAVAAGSTLRWVSSNAAVVALYGANWNRQIDDISDAFFTDYKFGADINTASDFARNNETAAATSIDADLSSPGGSYVPNTIPSAPTLYDLGGTVGSGATLGITWSASNGTTNYTLQRDTSPSFINAATIYTGSSSNTIDSPATLGTSYYYYRVRAENSIGASAWSNTVTLIVNLINTGSAPAAPVLTDPGASVGAGTAFTINWSNSNGATSYTLQRDTVASFTNAVNVYTGANTNTIDTTSSTYTGPYYYRVKANNSYGASPWSNTVDIQSLLSFLPTAPTLLDPGASIASGTAFSISWSATNSAVSYTLQRDTNSQFNNPSTIYNSAGISTTDTLSSYLSTTYYYRVRANTGVASSAWSNIVDMGVTAASALPSAPIVTEPGEKVLLGATFQLNWAPVAGATDYTLQVADTNAFSPAITTISHKPDNYWKLSYDKTGTYYFRVKATNASGDSVWSNTVDMQVADRVNTYTQSGQSNSKVALDQNGNFVIVWTSYGQDGSGYGIYAQRYNSQGMPQGSEFKVNTYTADAQTAPAIAMDANGNFAIVWASSGQDSSLGGVYGQRYDSQGTALGSEFRVNTYTPSNQLNPAIAMNASGSFVVTWQSYGEDMSGNGIFAQMYNSQGVARGHEFRANTVIAGSQFSPAIAIDSNGNFLIAWISANQDGSGYGVYAQRFDSMGGVNGTEFKVNTYTAGDQSYPTAALDNNGNAAIVWTSSGQDGNGYGVYGQNYNADGTKHGSEFKINDYTAGDQSYPNVSADRRGYFAITWSSYGQDGNDQGVYAKVINLGGTAIASEFKVNAYTQDRQTFPAAAMNENNNYVITWTSNLQDGSSTGIYAKALTLAIL